MSTAAAIVLVVLAVLALLAIGGAIAAARRRREHAAAAHREVEEADRALAAAHAEDKGWDRAGLEAAAREAFAARYGAAEIRSLSLVQVLDLPGMQADQAVFRVRTADDEQEIVLGRHEGDWVAL